MYAIMKSKQYC